MTPQILVTGGTGTLGRRIVARLSTTGHSVRVLSRHAPPTTDRVEYVAADLATGEGTAAAVDGSDIIIHCAGSNKGDEDKTRHLLEAASKAGCRHLVYISVVGAERIPVVSGVDRAMFGYFASKRASEQVIEASSLPWTTLRATQFHELALLTAQGLAKLPVIPIPAGFRFQPIDSDEVAARLVELALGAPAGQVPDIAGPKTYPMAHLQRSYLHALGMHHVLVPLYVPGKAANAIRHGANLTPDGDLGGRTWEDFLSAHVATAVK